jgi:retron-type reverse transcriptase
VPIAAYVTAFQDRETLTMKRMERMRYLRRAQGGEVQFPLTVPTLKDRVMQCLVKLALEPEWEAVFEPHSYGFRRGRSVRDATVAVKHGLGAEGAGHKNQRSRCHWVLDADIKSFFDEIDHEVILSRTPVFRRVIEGWLKAGVFTGEVFDPTEMGTPQGGVITPPTILRRLVSWTVSYLVRSSDRATGRNGRQAGSEAAFCNAFFKEVSRHGRFGAAVGAAGGAFVCPLAFG